MNSFIKQVLLTVFVLSMLSGFGRSIVRGSPLRSANGFRRLYSESLFPIVDISAAESLDFTGDLLVVPFYQSKESTKDDKAIANGLKAMIPPVPLGTKKLISDILDEGIFKAEALSKQIVRAYGADKSPKYVALVGLGSQDQTKGCDSADITTANQLGNAVASIASSVKASSVGVVVPAGVQSSGISQLILGVHDASYADTRFKKVPEGGHKPSLLKSVQLLGCSTDIAATSRQSEIIASGVKFAKDLVGAPANSKTPLEIATQARQIAAESGMEIKVLGEKECRELGMGAYLAVQQGSRFPPQFIHITYKPQNPTGEVKKVAMVGKGLTFDSGGYNLKVGAGSSIELMKFDMGGCGAVLGCAKAIGQLKPQNVEVHFITAVCENMISAEAMRPGDIVAASNGKTVEIINTDAEGRLTLADALVYAEKLQVDSIIDLATLTGAVVVGLGEKLAGLYSTDNQLRSELESAARKTDEGIWSLPLVDSYRGHVKSNIADLKNVGAKGGGSITAALFLNEFVEKTPWAHIDMAGPVWDSTANKPTGYGVKLLTEYLLNAKKQGKK